MVSMSLLSKIIRKEREALGMTQEELGKRVNVTGAMVSRWETDRNRVEPSHFKNISEVLGIPPEELWKAFDGEESDNIDSNITDDENNEAGDSNVLSDEEKPKAHKKSWLTTNRLKTNRILLSAVFFAAILLPVMLFVSWFNAMLFQNYHGLHRIHLVGENNVLVRNSNSIRLYDQPPAYLINIAENHESSLLVVMGVIFLTICLLTMPFLLMDCVIDKLVDFSLFYKYRRIKKKRYTNDVFKEIGGIAFIGILFNILFMIGISHIGRTLETPAEITFGLFDYLEILIYSIIIVMAICGLSSTRKASNATKQAVHSILATDDSSELKGLKHEADEVVTCEDDIEGEG